MNDNKLLHIVINRLIEQYKLTPHEFQYTEYGTIEKRFMWCPDSAPAVDVIIDFSKVRITAHIGINSNDGSYKQAIQREWFVPVFMRLSFSYLKLMFGLRKLTKSYKNKLLRDKQKRHEKRQLEALRSIDETFSEITDNHLLGGSK